MPQSADLVPLPALRKPPPAESGETTELVPLARPKPKPKPKAKAKVPTKPKPKPVSAGLGEQPRYSIATRWDELSGRGHLLGFAKIEDKLARRILAQTARAHERKVAEKLAARDPKTLTPQERATLRAATNRKLIGYGKGWVDVDEKRGDGKIVGRRKRVKIAYVRVPRPAAVIVFGKAPAILPEPKPVSKDAAPHLWTPPKPPPAERHTMGRRDEETVYRAWKHRGAFGCMRWYGMFWVDFGAALGWRCAGSSVDKAVERAVRPGLRPTDLKLFPAEPPKRKRWRPPALPLAR